MKSLKVGDKCKREDEIAFPKQGYKVRVRALSVSETLEANTLANAINENDEVQAEIAICSLGILDDDGKQAFNSDEGRATIADLPEMMRRRISSAILGLTGLDGVSLKNS